MFSRHFFFLFMLLSILGGCTASPVRESTGEYIDSSAITAKVKARLVDQLGAKSLPIKVKTYKDVVQLSGFIDSDMTRMRAGEVASHTAGVREVRNDLVIKH